MKVVYIHHSSFLVELEEATFIFDYYKGDLPKIDHEKPLYIFASHNHSDHFSKNVFALSEQASSVAYILSNDISIGSVPKGLEDKVHFIGPHERFYLNELEIETLLSTDEGVAFCIKCCGKIIYHAGDLHNWIWQEEGDSWNESVSEKYQNEIDKLKDKIIDVAFLPLDPRQGDWFNQGMDYFLDVVSVKHVFPMHFWKQYDIIKKYKALPNTGKYGDLIEEIRREGQVFEIE